MIPKITKFQYREWHISPIQDQHNCFRLCTQAGDEICMLYFSNASHCALVKLIAAAPELKDIAEMYRDTMTGNRAEKSMIFNLVNDVLNRVF